MESHGVACRSVTHHRWTRPSSHPAKQTGIQFTYPEGMEGWVDLGIGYIVLKYFTCPSADSYLSK